MRGLPSLAARRRRRIRPSHHTTIPLVSHHTAIVAHHDPSRWEGLLAAQRHLCSLATSHTGPHAPRRTTALRRRACGHRWRWRRRTRRRPTPEALCRRCGGCAFYVLNFQPDFQPDLLRLCAPAVLSVLSRVRRSAAPQSAAQGVSQRRSLGGRRASAACRIQPGASGRITRKLRARRG